MLDELNIAGSTDGSKFEEQASNAMIRIVSASSSLFLFFLFSRPPFLAVAVKSVAAHWFLGRTPDTHYGRSSPCSMASCSCSSPPMLPGTEEAFLGAIAATPLEASDMLGAEVVGHHASVLGCVCDGTVES
jgi:hypothetical protein